MSGANGGPPPTLADVHAAFADRLAFPDDEEKRPRYDSIDIALACVIANRMDADPLWLFLVAPPSSGKTEIISSLSDVPDVFPLSSLSAQTFASGFEKKGVETSLLPKISGKLVVMKDFGTVLTMYREKRAEILAQLREIYDGSYTKEWGNGKSLAWEGKVSLVCGVTPIIDSQDSLNAVLGERFVLYRFEAPPARTLATRAMQQTSEWEQEQRRALRRVVATYLDTLLPVPPPTPPAIFDALAALAEFTATARSPVFRDQRTKDVILIPPPEAPGRLAKQLYLLAKALAVVRREREVSLATYATALQVAHDTLPAARQEVLAEVLKRGSTPVTTTDIATARDYPTSTARYHLQELAAVRLLKRTSEGQGKSDLWSPRDELLGLMDDIRKPFVETTIHAQA
jgi:hypothetical protein